MTREITGKGRSVVLVGAGVFGLTGALELRARGWTVTVIDQGEVPHPDAASNDISKIIRMDYGADAFYADLAEQAIEGWDHWNATWGWTPFERVGFLIMAQEGMRPGQFEHDSFRAALTRGRDVRRLTDPETRKRFGIWPAHLYPDGYLNLDAGWSPSGRVIQYLLGLAAEAGIRVMKGRTAEVILDSRPGVVLQGGAIVYADRVVVAAGSWSPTLLPELEGRIWATAQSVYHLHVEHPSRFQPPGFVPWAAATASTGWYGFPALDDGTLKLANHGPGRIIDPREVRGVHPGEDAAIREFLAMSLPELAYAPIVRRRMCVYTDSFDSDFFIDEVPGRAGVVVATGGSGHGFKFAPVLGPIIADAVDGKENRLIHERFHWRDRGPSRLDPARFAGPSPRSPEGPGGGESRLIPLADLPSQGRS